MQGDRDGTAGKYPWWQQRASTVRRSTGQAAFYCVMAVAWLVVIAPAFVVEGSGGWRLPVAVFFGVGWVVLAAAHVAGAVAQRREVVSSGSR